MSLIAAGAVLVVLAVPVLHIHTADSGMDGLPRSLEMMQTYDRMQAAFPGEQFTADIVVDGELAAGRGRGAARAPGRARGPTRSTADHGRYERPTASWSVVHVPLAGSGTDDASIDALAELRQDVVPELFARGGSESAASPPDRSTSTT